MIPAEHTKVVLTVIRSIMANVYKLAAVSGKDAVVEESLRADIYAGLCTLRDSLDGAIEFFKKKEPNENTGTDRE